MSESKSVATQAQRPRDIGSVLQLPAIRGRFEEMLGKRSAAFMSSIISAVNGNAALRNCDPMSVVSAAAVAASMDLPINPSLGFAHIVPYKGQAQFQVGAKGFVQLALRSGQYKTINLSIVFDGQIKKHNPFTGDMEFDHTVVSENVAGYLLYFRLLNGFEKYFYMTADECHDHGKRYSRSYQDNKGVWVENFDAMALKTVAKLGLSKYGILSVEMQKALEMDQAAVTENMEPRYIDGEATEAAEVEPAGPAAAAEALNKKIRSSKKNAAEPESATPAPAVIPPDTQAPPSTNGGAHF